MEAPRTTWAKSALPARKPSVFPPAALILGEWRRRVGAVDQLLVCSPERPPSSTASPIRSKEARASWDFLVVRDASIVEVWRMRVVISSLTWCCLLFSGMMARPAFAAEEPSQKPEPFAAEVRYHFREKIRDAKPGENASRPHRMSVKLCLYRKRQSLNGNSAQQIEGRVPHLPYRFLIKVIRSKDAGSETIEVNVLG